MVLDDFKEIHISSLYVINNGTDEEWIDSSPEEKVNILEKMASKTKVFIPHMISNPKKAVQIFEEEIKKLKDAGLDIGKGNAEYGYKMPLPEKDKPPHRRLLIYKRG